MEIRKIATLLGSLILVLVFTMVFFAVADSTPPTISVGDGAIAEVGSTTTVNITLDQAPNGLSGYKITVSVSDPSVAEITGVKFPSWATMNDNSTLPADSFWMKAVDLNEEVEAGTTDIDLGTLTIRGDATGECEIDVAIEHVDDDSGDPINPSVSPGTLTVSGTPAVFRVTPEGNVLADGAYYGQHFYSGSADVAEWVPVSEVVEPGDVLELDPKHPGHYRKSRGPFSTLVAGVVSTNPGFVLGADPLTSDFGHWTPDSALLALIGIIPVRVTNEGGQIEPGDLLVSSSTSGYAMRWEEKNDLPPGSFVGKALEPLTTDASGVILVLLMAH